MFLLFPLVKLNIHIDTALSLATCPALLVILVMLFTAMTLHDNSFTEHVFGNLPGPPLDSRTMQHLLVLKPLVKVGSGQVLPW